MSSAEICFIGGGNMARAMIAGAVTQGFKPSDIVVIERNQEKCQALSQNFGIKASVEAEEMLATNPGVFILAVKPQNFGETITQYLSVLNQKSVGVVSLAPGISLQALQEKLPNSQIVRVMPNTPSSIHLGATGMVAGSRLLPHVKDVVEKLFSSIGICAWVENEQQLDVVVALSGCGPAYYFYMLEIFIEKAKALGLPKSIAENFAEQTLLGAGQLAKQSELPVEALRSQVTSKGGVTAVALDKMKSEGIESLLGETMQAALRRIKEMEQVL